MIAPDTIAKIKEAIDIVDVISDFVELKRSGQSYKALSPFTNEKTPSFFVSPSKDIFKCFSTGKGGDAISFIMELEGLSYTETLRYLAQKYGIEIQETEDSDEVKAQRSQRESLFIILNYAKEYFKHTLLESEEGRSIGMSYFKERGFHKKTIEDFDLGYSTSEWDGLLKDALKNQYSKDLLEKAGLIIAKENKAYDRFRDRVIFPIHNLTGRVIAFGARTLKSDKKIPKYLNSPETDVYHKSKVLYGLFQARNEVRNKDQCILVEGYTDVLSMHQAGITNTVASSGTSLTDEQIKMISRYTKNITVLFDGDEAGIKASLRGIDLILEGGLNVKALVLPDGQDPDSMVKSTGGDGFDEYIMTHEQDFITFKTKLLLDETGNDPIKRADVIRSIVESIAKVPDSIKRTVFFQQCSQLLDIEEQVLVSEYNKMVLQKRRKEQTGQEYREASQGRTEALAPQKDKEDTNEDTSVDTVRISQEKELVRLLMKYGDIEVEDGLMAGDYMLKELEDVPFEDNLYARIIEELRHIRKEGGWPDDQYFLSHIDDGVKKLAIDVFSEPYSISDNWYKHHIFVSKESDDPAKMSYSAVLRFKWWVVRQMVKENIQQLKTADTEEKIQQVQEKHLQLKQLEMEIAKELGNVTTA